MAAILDLKQSVRSSNRVFLALFVIYSVKINYLIRNGSINNRVIGIPVYTVNTAYFT